MHFITGSCVLILWIRALTSEKIPDCTLEQFLKGSSYDSNFDTTNLEASYPAGKQVRVSCNIGYSGFFKLLCVGGEWIPKGTKCEPRSCGHPGEATFAEFHLEKGDDFVFGAQVAYTCHKGYQMVSRTNYRRCMAGGWDLVVPVCEAQQCPVIQVDKKVKVVGDLEEATYNNVVQFSCKSSSEVLIGLQEIYCKEDGEWSGEAPKCTEIKCLVPVIERGEVRGDIREYKEGEVLHFECDLGFKPADVRPTKCTKQGIRVEWSPTPACELITCELSLPPLEGTRYRPANRNVFSVGDSITVTCGERYWISDPRQTSAQSTCRDNGQWTVTPVCKEVTCSNRRDSHVSWWDVYWGQRVTLGETVRYSCRRGYKKTVDAHGATCTRDGWAPDPLCQVITCDRRDIPNTVIVNSKDEYRDSEEATYTCNNGYEGRFHLTCRKEGWSGDSQCREKSCERHDISNADIVSVDKERYSHREQVQYACRKDGARRFTVVCNKGVWSGIESCRDCPRAEIPHGFAVGPYGGKLYYTCYDGYKLSTKGWWAEATCIGTVWSGLHLCIENSSCAGVPVIPHGEVTLALHNIYVEGKSVEIICKGGHIAQVDQITCLEGNWQAKGFSLESICTPTAAEHCSPPPKVADAIVVTAYQREYLSGSEVTYRCRPNNTMEGRATIRCNDGSWQQGNITCTQIKCLVPVIERGEVRGDIREYKEGEVLHFECDLGFKPADVRPTKCTKQGIRVEWSPTPACELITCELSLPPLEGTRYRPADRNVFSVGDSITVTCGERYWISDPRQTSAQSTCRDNGQWTVTPVCKEVTCSNRRDSHVSWWDVHWGQRITLGETVRYSCRRGYKKTGDAHGATCTRDGWAPDPLCQAPTLEQ